jgi:hypothetical protein
VASCVTHAQVFSRSRYFNLLFHTGRGCSAMGFFSDRFPFSFSHVGQILSAVIWCAQSHWVGIIKPCNVVTQLFKKLFINHNMCYLGLT